MLHMLSAKELSESVDFFLLTETPGASVSFSDNSKVTRETYPHQKTTDQPTTITALTFPNHVMLEIFKHMSRKYSGLSLPHTCQWWQ